MVEYRVLCRTLNTIVFVDVGSPPATCPADGCSNYTIEGGTTVSQPFSQAAGEINALTSKASPVAADQILIEDSADSFKKKKAAFPTGGGVDTTAIHKATAAEISAMTEKTALVNADLFVIEDSADSNNKKKVQMQTVAGKGCREYTPYMIGLSGGTTGGWAWDATAKLFYASLSCNNGVTGYMRVSGHVPFDFRAFFTGAIRTRSLKSGNFSRLRITMYRNGVADATINLTTIPSGAAWTNDTFTPGSTYSPDEDLSFEIEITGSTGGCTFQLAIIDVDYLRRA